MWMYGEVLLLIEIDTEGHIWQWIYTCDNADMLLGLQKLVCSFQMGYRKNISESSSKPNQAPENTVSLFYIYF